MWIGTRHGLNTFDPVTRKFAVYPLNNSGDGKSDLISCVVANKNNDLYIGTFNGLYFYNATVKKITPIEIPDDNNKKVQNNSITHLALDDSGVLWIATSNGLWSYHKQSHRLSHEINATNDPQFAPVLSYLIVDHAQKIWVGSWGKGLKKFDPATKNITTYSISGAPVITSIAEIIQPSGNFILWLNGDFIGFDPVKNEKINFQLPSKFPSLPKIRYLYTSTGNWLWIGTPDGLCFYNPSRTLFKQHFFAKPITGQDVSLLEWNHKILVSGSGSNFLKAYDTDLVVTDNYGKGITEEDMSCLALT